jgi:hypothetical protein
MFILLWARERETFVILTCHHPILEQCPPKGRARKIKNARIFISGFLMKLFSLVYMFTYTHTRVAVKLRSCKLLISFCRVNLFQFVRWSAAAASSLALELLLNTVVTIIPVTGAHMFSLARLRNDGKNIGCLQKYFFAPYIVTGNNDKPPLLLSTHKLSTSMAYMTFLRTHHARRPIRRQERALCVCILRERERGIMESIACESQ